MYQQKLDPLVEILPQGWSSLASTTLAFLPVLVLFALLVIKRWEAPKAGATAGVFALLIAVFVYQMPWSMAISAYFNGMLFGLLPIGFTVVAAMLLYNLTVETGCFKRIKESVESLSGDPRIQAVLVGFSFGAFLEGAAGSGTPVAICGAILVGMGFNPIQAAVLCLLANTSPVAYGALGNPLLVLGKVTDLPTETLSVMAGHQLPLLSLFVPIYMTICLCGIRKTFEVWPVLAVAGGSFALFQYIFATLHTWIPGAVVYLMTDIGGGFFSLGITAVYLRFFWNEGKQLDFPVPDAPETITTPNDIYVPKMGAFKAWLPFLLMSFFLVGHGFLRQVEERNKGSVQIGPIHSAFSFSIPMLDRLSLRDPAIQDPTKQPEGEKAVFLVNWLTTPGSAVVQSIILSIIILRPNWSQLRRVFRSTAQQMFIPLPTIGVMLGMSYLSRYAGMDATLGVAFAQTGSIYPFFAAMLGWLGVFLTGTDAGSNALFGSLQKITAIAVEKTGVLAIDSGQAQILLSTANSTGGVMGKMIDAQSIVVATSATGLSGKEAEIFKRVVWHSVALAMVVGALTMAQAYIWPFTLMVPGLPKEP